MKRNNYDLFSFNALVNFYVARAKYKQDPTWMDKFLKLFSPRELATMMDETRKSKIVSREINNLRAYYIRRHDGKRHKH